jgi:NAD-dependent dihydropyrimidine dehydrogenase PreA subunit/bacterioferritin-associated ferredoxin
MKVVNVRARVKIEHCKGCKTCELVCPTYAIKVKRKGEEPQVSIDETLCVGCWNCEQRCPEYAIEMVSCDPRRLETDISKFEGSEIEALCRQAKFHPKQVVCYCTASRAEELAAAILGGARTPDQLVLGTGVGSGCGIECNQPIQRFLKAAGLEYNRPKQSYQWYGSTVTAWEVSSEVKKKYPIFRFEDDRQLFDRIVMASKRRSDRIKEG